MTARNEPLIDAVWQHGRAMPEADAAHWRQDACGAWMRCADRRLPAGVKSATMSQKAWAERLDLILRKARAEKAAMIRHAKC